MWVSKPSFNGNDWVVKVKKDKSPLSEPKETFKTTSETKAWEIYYKIMKELGRGN